MKKIILLFVVLIVAMEGLGWWAYKKSQKSDSASAETSRQLAQKSSTEKSDTKSQDDKPKDGRTDDQIYSGWSDNSSQATSPFLAPFVEKIGNATQRTIHMGVRQWEWVPATITANYEEKVILIMHNADVAHLIFIPELNVGRYIPSEGAVVQFTADKRGTFAFFCDVPCGKGHGQMKGEITIT